MRLIYSILWVIAIIYILEYFNGEYSLENVTGSNASHTVVNNSTGESWKTRGRVNNDTKTKDVCFTEINTEEIICVADGLKHLTISIAE